MKVTVTQNSILKNPVSSWDGRRLHHVDTNDNGEIDDTDPLLVARYQDAWYPVGRLDEPVDRFAIENRFALWTDAEPWDGLAQAEEVQSLGSRPQLGQGPSELGAEIVRLPGGALQLHRHQCGSSLPAGEHEHYRNDNSHWRVGIPPSQSGC